MKENPKVFINSKEWDNSIEFRKGFDGIEYPHGVDVELYFTGGNVEKRYNCNRVNYGYKKNTRKGHYLQADTGCTYCGTQSVHRTFTGDIATSKLSMIRITKSISKWKH